jgi:hypothetical protein
MSLYFYRPFYVMDLVVDRTVSIANNLVRRCNLVIWHIIGSVGCNVKENSDNFARVWRLRIPGYSILGYSIPGYSIYEENRLRKLILTLVHEFTL